MISLTTLGWKIDVKFLTFCLMRRICPNMYGQFSFHSNGSLRLGFLKSRLRQGFQWWERFLSKYQAHRKVCLTFTHYVKVDDLLTEKAVVCDGRGERGATETNNLVCTKKQKHIYGNSTHETTQTILKCRFINPQ